MKKSLLLVVSLLAIASLMAAMAYTSATVDNKTTLTVVNSNEALLSLTPGESLGNGNDSAYLNKDGKLEINLDKGLNGQMYGIQSNSFYKWDDLFTVKNNSENTIKFRIDKEDGIFGFNTKVNGYIGAIDEDGIKSEFLNRSNNKGGWTTLSPGETASVYIYAESETAKRVTTPGTLRITSEAVESAQ